MLFTTTTQWVVLALVLIGGWLLGLASHPGGRRWRDRYAAERDAHTVTRREAEARSAETDARATTLAAETQVRLADAHARIAELERDHARPVAPATVTPAMSTPAMSTRAEPIASTSTATYPVRVTSETDSTGRMI